MEIQVTINLNPSDEETLVAMLSALSRHGMQSPTVAIVQPEDKDAMGPLETEFMRRNPSRTKRLVMTTGNLAKYGNREAFAAFLLSNAGNVPPVNPDSVGEAETAPIVSPVSVDELDADDI